MAYSASKDFALTRDDIIAMALRKIGVYDSMDSTPAAELAAAALSLNTLVKEWTAEGLALWLRDTVVLFLRTGKQRYKIGGATAVSDFCVPLASIEYTTLDGAHAAGSTTLAITGWVDYAGATKSTTVSLAQALIRLDDGTIDVRTPSIATTTTVTGSAITSDAGSGNPVYRFANSSRISRPARILTAYRTDSSGNSAEVELIGRVDYEQLSRKSSDGEPLKIHFDPQLDQAQILVWPSTHSPLDQLMLVVEYYPDDFDSASNNPQFPIEWGNALVWNLAMELSFEYGTDVKTRTQIAQIALHKKDVLFNTADRENASVTFAVTQ